MCSSLIVWLLRSSCIRLYSLCMWLLQSFLRICGSLTVWLLRSSCTRLYSLRVWLLQSFLWMCGSLTVWLLKPSRACVVQSSCVFTAVALCMCCRQWLERWTTDWKIAGSNPCRSGGICFVVVVLQGQLSVLTLASVSVPTPCYRSST